MIANSKRLLASGLAVVFVAALGVSTPVLAEGGSSGSGSNSGSSDSSSTTTSTETQNETENQTTEKQHVEDRVNGIKTEAHQEIEAARTNLKDQGKEKRMKSCEARKANLTKRMNNAVAQATKHKAVFDKIFAKAQSLHDTQKLNADNYDALVAAAKTAQTNAQTNIDTLKALDINIDCTSNNVADNVAAFRTAVGNTRDSLKAYRKSIVDILNALNAANKTTNDSNTDDSSTNSSTN